MLKPKEKLTLSVHRKIVLYQLLDSYDLKLLSRMNSWTKMTQISIFMAIDFWWNFDNLYNYVFRFSVQILTPAMLELTHDIRNQTVQGYESQLFFRYAEMPTCYTNLLLACLSAVKWTLTSIFCLICSSCSFILGCNGNSWTQLSWNECGPK